MRYVSFLSIAILFGCGRAQDGAWPSLPAATSAAALSGQAAPTTSTSPQKLTWAPAVKVADYACASDNDWKYETNVPSAYGPYISTLYTVSTFSDGTASSTCTVWVRSVGTPFVGATLQSAGGSTCTVNEHLTGLQIANGETALAQGTWTFTLDDRDVGTAMFQADRANPGGLKFSATLCRVTRY